MKVGIMSMQRIINYGSFLQAYALKKTIESIGHDVEFVDYHIGEPIVIAEHSNGSKKSKFHRLLKASISKKYRQKRKNEIAQNEAYGNFYNIFKSEWLSLLGVTDKKNYNPDIDVLIIGSDEVFNCTQSNPDVGYSPELFGMNSCAKRIVTYAASFGNTTIDKLDKHNKIDEITCFLKRINQISVRDRNSYDIVNKLTGYVPVMNVDPVLIYDFKKEVPDKVNLDNYVIVYAYSGRITDEEAEAIQKFAHRNGKKTLSIGVMQSFTDEYRCVDPFMMLSYFKNADFVVTDTFHGTVFSIKYQVPFITFIRDSNKEKLSDLLDKFDLQNRVGNYEEISNILEKQFVESKIRILIDKYKYEALDYIKSC